MKSGSNNRLPDMPDATHPGDEAKRIAGDLRQLYKGLLQDFGNGHLASNCPAKNIEHFSKGLERLAARVESLADVAGEYPLTGVRVSVDAWQALPRPSEAVQRMIEEMQARDTGHYGDEVIIKPELLREWVSCLKATVGPGPAQDAGKCDENRLIRCVHCGCFLAYQGDADGYEVEACDCRGDPDCADCGKRIEYEGLHARIDTIRAYMEQWEEVAKCYKADLDTANARVRELESRLSMVTQSTGRLSDALAEIEKQKAKYSTLLKGAEEDRVELNDLHTSYVALMVELDAVEATARAEVDELACKHKVGLDMNNKLLAERDELLAEVGELGDHAREARSERDTVLAEVERLEMMVKNREAVVERYREWIRAGRKATDVEGVAKARGRLGALLDAETKGGE